MRLTYRYIYIYINLFDHSTIEFTIYLLILRQNEPTWLSLDARIHVKIKLLINMLQ